MSPKHILDYKPIKAKDTEKKFRKKYQQSTIKEIKFKPIRTNFSLGRFFDDIWMYLKPVRKFAGEKAIQIMDRALDIFITKYGWILVGIVIIGIVIILWSLA